MMTIMAAGSIALAGPAQAAPCSTSAAVGSCTVATSATITAGTLGLRLSPALYWSFVTNGYDQFASASATALSSCAATGTVTSCTAGTAPKITVVDATGAGSGWSLSAYVSSSTLPAGSVLTFAGSGSSTIGTSTNSPVATNPFAATTPDTTCDYGSSCTNATAATASACSHSGLGFTTCPTYPVNLLSATSATSQVDLYSADTSTGLGAICFGSGTATATGCTGLTPAAFFNLGVKGSAAAGTYTGAVINLAVTSGP